VPALRRSTGRRTPKLAGRRSMNSPSVPSGSAIPPSPRAGGAIGSTSCPSSPSRKPYGRAGAV
jgi:hypothetical protein